MGYANPLFNQLLERRLVLCPISSIADLGNSTGAGIAVKSKYRNPKSETIPKSKCSKLKANCPPMRLLPVLVIRILVI